MEVEVKEKNGGEAKNYEVEETFNTRLGTDSTYRHHILWHLAALHAILHLGWLVGVYTIITYNPFKTFAWGMSYGFVGLMGIAAGAHRCYSHKAFKPTRTLEVLFLYAQTISGQNSMFTWVRDHIAHHKYSDTDADPHNASRGFFYAHMGWLVVKKHPLTVEKQKQLDVSDLLSNKYVMFQYKYFLPLYTLIGFAVPISVPMYLWNENFWNAFFVAYIFPYVTSLHFTWGINSFAHLWGTKPFDTRIMAKESPVMIYLGYGEGYHNYHHAFPWDYRISEHGRHGGLTTSVIDLLAYLGLAYDLKTAHPDLVVNHLKRHGDENRTAKQVAIEEWKMKEAAFKKMKALINDEDPYGLLDILRGR